MELVGSKTASQSTTIRAIVVGLLGLLAAAGHQLVPIDDPRVSTAVEVIGYIISFVAYLVAWFGRLNATQRIARSSTVPLFAWAAPLLLVLMIGGGGIGCTSRGELISLRESMYANQRTRNEEHMDLVRKLGPGGDRNTLPTYTANDIAIREDNLKTYEDLVQRSRDRDKNALSPQRP